MNDETTLSIELDLLPEHIHYKKDEGCDMSPACLSCPLESCVYDTPHGKQSLIKRRRNEEIELAYRREGLSYQEMARQFHVNKRTVQRVLKGKGAT